MQNLCDSAYELGKGVCVDWHVLFNNISSCESGVDCHCIERDIAHLIGLELHTVIT